MTRCTVFNSKASPFIGYVNRGTYKMVYIGRSRRGQGHMLNTEPCKTGWLGNPYRTGTREECIAKFRIAFAHKLRTDPVFRDNVKTRLAGAALMCYCKPLPCHGDVIAEYINAGCPDDWESDSRTNQTLTINL